MDINSSIPMNVMKSCSESSEDAITFQTIENNDNNTNKVSSSINENNRQSVIFEKYEDIQPPEKGYTIPLTIDIPINNRTNYYIKNTENDLMRTSSSPAIKYSSMMTNVSATTKIPNKQYNKTYFNPNSIFNSENYTKNVISTGIRPTTKIITKPMGVDDSNIVSLPFSPRSQSYNSSPSSALFNIQNKGLVSHSITNTSTGDSFSPYDEPFSSFSNKLVVKIHEGQSQCILPDLSLQTVEEEKDEDASQGLGKMYVFIIRVNCHQKLYNPYVTVHLGEQQYSTCVSGMAEGLWNEGFMFDISIHTQFFGILTFNLYNGNICLPDRFIGKSEIRIESLKQMPEMFDSWYELLDKYGESPGAINIRIFYKYQDFHIPIKNNLTNNLFVENDDNNNNNRNVTSREIQSLEQTRNISRMGTINEKEFAKFENELMSSLGKAPKSWYDSIGKMFISDEMFNVLRMIRRTISILGQGCTLGPTQLLEGILVLEKYYQKKEPDFETMKTSNGVIHNLSLVEKTRDLFRYALAAYGWIGLNYVGQGKGIIADSIKKDSSVATMINFLCLSKEDILLYNFQPSKVFDQVYFIAYERRYDAIIFSIRGTLNVKDTLADLVCEYVRWNGGLVHSGILSSAIYFYKNLFNKLKEIVHEKQSRYLYLTGHSLGAGIAAALTIMLKNVENEFDAPPGFKIECYCFAPPSSFDMELSKVYEDCIFSFINNNDIVPRLSYGSVMDLYEMICSVIENNKENEISLIKLLSKDSKTDEFIAKKLNEFEKCRKNLRTQSLFNVTNLKLCPPGKAYNILNNPQKHEEVILKEVDLDDLTEIKVRKSMFMDHSFKGYYENLKSLFESTILNKLNSDIKMTNSPKSMTENTFNESDTSTSTAAMTNVVYNVPVQEVSEISSSNDETSYSQNILKDTGKKNSNSLLINKN
ncbi:hypothetical protein LY90DRAFT_706343, partial [Neocallimastix californiae]